MLAAFKLRAVPDQHQLPLRRRRARVTSARTPTSSRSLYQPRARARASPPSRRRCRRCARRRRRRPTYEAAIATRRSSRRLARARASRRARATTSTSSTPAARPGMPRGVMWRHEDVFFAGLQGGNPGGDPLIERPEELAPLARERRQGADVLSGGAVHPRRGAVGGVHRPLRRRQGRDRRRAAASTRAGACAARSRDEQVNTHDPRRRRHGAPAGRRAARAGRELRHVVADRHRVGGRDPLATRCRSELAASSCPNMMILNNFGASETGPPGRRASSTTDGARPRFYMDETQHRARRRPAPARARLGRDGQAGAPRAHPARLLQRSGEDRGDVPRRSTASAGSSPATSPPSRRTGRSPCFGRGAVCINIGGEKIFPEEVEDGAQGASRRARTRSSSACPTSAGASAWRPSCSARPGADVTLGELDAHCRTRIAGYKVPRAAPPRRRDGAPPERQARLPLGQSAKRCARLADARRPACLAGSLAELFARRRLGEPATVAAAVRALGDDRDLRRRRRAAESQTDLRGDRRGSSARAGRRGCARCRPSPRATRSSKGSYGDHRAQFMDRGGAGRPVEPDRAADALCAPKARSRVGARDASGRPFEGAPGFVHGGFRRRRVRSGVRLPRRCSRGVPSLTASLTVHYRKPTPHRRRRCASRPSVERTEGRKSVRARAACTRGGERHRRGRGAVHRASSAEQFNAAACEARQLMYIDFTPERKRAASGAARLLRARS